VSMFYNRRAVSRSQPGSFNIASPDWGWLASVLSYFLRKKGPMTHAAMKPGGFVKTPGLGWSARCADRGKPVFNGWRRQDRGY